MEKIYNIVITFEGLDLDFIMDLRTMFKNYEVDYTINNIVNIKNADSKLIEHLEQWDINIKENI